jgi:plasmid maintenance system antidote protein VapI
MAGTAAVTPEIAVRIGKLCGNGPQLWINLQTARGVWLAKQKLAKDLEKIPTQA